MSNNTLIRLQAGSGLVFAVFLTLHLLTTLSAPFGQRVFDSLQASLRHYYQFPLIEVAAVLGAALVHIGTGLTRMWRRRSSAKARIPLRYRLHRYSGYYMMAAFTGHVSATRLPPLLFRTTIDFSFLTFSLTKFPFIFYPYYFLLFACGLYHLSSGVAMALRIVIPKRAFTYAMAAGASCGLVALLALGGVLYRVDTHRFAQFQALLDRVTVLVR